MFDTVFSIWYASIAARSSGIQSKTCVLIPTISKLLDDLIVLFPAERTNISRLILLGCTNIVVRLGY
jgi:hypothetical protein